MSTHHRNAPDQQLLMLMSGAEGGFLHMYKYSTCACKQCTGSDHPKICCCLPCNFPHMPEWWALYFF